MGLDDGLFVMVNFFKFCCCVEYVDGCDVYFLGCEVYEWYVFGVRLLIEVLGGWVVYLGVVMGLLFGKVEDFWDVVGLVEYFLFDAFCSMIALFEMRVIERYCSAGFVG